ncbi:MAG: sulfatase-like hydrolase/transferase [bacterium]|nr:sulfatase-like hydrolase/transferase [bacterium]
MNATKSKRNLGWIVGATLVGVALVVAVILVTRDRSTTRPVVLGEVIRPGAAEGFNVLLVTLDTTRADRLGCYGYEHARTPTIDGLVKHGVRFDDAVTSAPTTLAAHSTILTGLYPPSTGVHENGVNLLTPEFTTLAERLKTAGYDTAAFVASFVLDRRFGLDQGFDVYDFQADPEAAEVKSATSLEYERRADRVTNSALQWFKTRSAEGRTAPFFTWVHYYDPHMPYNSPLGGTATFAGRPYDAEIAFVDSHLKRLMSAFDEWGLRERTLVILVADHGEALGDHGEALHGVFVYESTMRVGLILSSPALFEQSYRVDDRVVGTVDIFPTVTELLGLDPEESDGISLLDTGAAADRALYIESYYPLTMGCAKLRGLRRHTDKYIEAPQPEYYDLVGDPAEADNLHDDGPPEAKELEQLLALQWPARAGGTGATRVLTTAELERLAALGYASTGNRQESDALPDPKERIGLINQMTEVTRLMAFEQYDEALELAQEVANQCDCWDAPVLKTAEILVNIGRHDEAVDRLDVFARRCNTTEAFFYLARSLLHLKRYAECERALDAAEVLDPTGQMGAVTALRGDLYFAQKRHREAIKQYERALELDAGRLGQKVRDNLTLARQRLQEPNP